MGEFADIAGYLADQTFGALKDAAQMATKGDPEFIRSGTPQSVYGKIVQGAARQACRRYADNPGSVRAGARAKAEESCRPYLSDIAYGQPGSVKVPFRGGQCEKLYRVQGEWRTESFLVCSSGITGGAGAYEFFSTEFSVLGPISGFSLSRITPACGGFDGHVISAQTPDGPVIVFQRAGTGAVRREVSFRILDVSAIDGVDNCGSPPPDIVNPVPPTIVGDPFERFNPDPSVDIDIGVRVNPDGTIDINLGTGDINIDPWGDGGGSGASQPNPGAEQEGEGGTIGGGENDFGEPPAGERWVGCEITITEEPPGVGRIPQSLPRDVYYAIEGNARLKFNSGGRIGYDTPVAIRSKTVFLWESVRGVNPSGVFVNLRPGFGYSVRPYSVPEEN